MSSALTKYKNVPGTEMQSLSMLTSVPSVSMNVPSGQEEGDTSGWKALHFLLLLSILGLVVALVIYLVKSYFRIARRSVQPRPESSKSQEKVNTAIIESTTSQKLSDSACKAEPILLSIKEKVAPLPGTGVPADPIGANPVHLSDISLSIIDSTTEGTWTRPPNKVA